MPRGILIGAGALAVALVVGWRMARPTGTETVFEPKQLPPQAAPFCPWREPETDLKAFFPSATRYETETRILSGARLELAQRLGRAPTPEENALRLFRVYQDQTPLGTVLTRRVKGQYGAIELVLAIDTEQRVRGLRLQRLREPDVITRALEDPAWRRSFDGKRVDDLIELGHRIAKLPLEAQASAQAIINGARGSLILLDVAERSHAQKAATSHHQ